MRTLHYGCPTHNKQSEQNHWKIDSTAKNEKLLPLEALEELKIITCYKQFWHRELKIITLTSKSKF